MPMCTIRCTDKTSSLSKGSDSDNKRFLCCPNLGAVGGILRVPGTILVFACLKTSGFSVPLSSPCTILTQPHCYLLYNLTGSLSSKLHSLLVVSGTLNSSLSFPELMFVPDFSIILRLSTFQFFKYLMKVIYLFQIKKKILKVERILRAQVPQGS